MNQENNYKEIVRRFADPNGDFARQFKNTMRKYRSGLSDEDIKDLYQESFLAAYKNLQVGQIKENTSWNSYIIRIGLNLATKDLKNHLFITVCEDPAAIDVNGGLDDDVAPYNSPEVQHAFGECLSFMNDSCRNILTLTLYNRLSCEEIAVRMDSTSQSIKTRRSKCKQMLVKLVRSYLKDLGYEITD